MIKSGRFHPVFEGFSPPPPRCRFPTFGKSGKIHSNVHVVFTELVLGSFPENHPCDVYITNVKKTLAHVILF